MDKPSDPLAILAKLSANEIRARLDQLDADRRALTTLLRSARARERFQSRTARIRQGAVRG